jgi:hypothetical protein
VLLTSADEDATAGLADLVRETGCRVVAAKEGLDAVRHRCPAGTSVLTGEECIKESGLEGKVIPLAGRGLAPLAYALKWAGKTVLVSGRIPVKMNVPEVMRLRDDLKGPGSDAGKYVRSLDRLAEVSPSVWLPAVPVHGQNANLYNEEWAEVLAQNRQAVALNAEKR